MGGSSGFLPDSECDPRDWADRARTLEQENRRLRRELAECHRVDRRLLSFAVEQSSEGIAVTDLDGKVLLVNSAFAHVHGREVEEFLGKHLSIFHAPEQMPAVNAAIQQILKTGNFSGESWHVHRDGTPFPTLMNNSLLRDDSGQPVGFVGTLRDITEEKAAEDERQKHIHFLESLERIDRAIREATDIECMLNEVVTTVRAIFDSDRAWLLYPCNPEAPSIRVPVESTRPEFPGACALDRDFPLPPRQAQALREALASKKPVINVNGTESPVDGEITCQFDVQSQMYSAVFPRIGDPWLFGMHQCSHPREWIEEERELFTEIGRRIADGLSSTLFLRNLQESEARYRTLFDVAPLGIQIHRIDGTLVDVNPKSCQMHGYAREEFLALSLKEFLTESTMIGFGHATEEVSRGMTVHDCGQEYCADGTAIDVEIHGAPFMHQGELHFLAISNDITERKLIEREREDLIARLEAQNAELERYAYTVSHDLKAPLITIKGFLGVLREDLADGDREAVDCDISRITRAADHMGLLLNDLLALSRVGRLVNPPGDVALEDLVSDAKEILSGKIKQTGVQLIVAPDLPILYGDGPRLAEVLQNLIDNALKYMGTQPQPRIEVGVRKEGDHTLCFVRDNGIGIMPEYHERVFGLFEQLDKTTEGSGVGLSLVKRIVELHGGRVWVQSSGEGHGSTFCFTVPLKPT
jgi:PAS domain S-box-containing protein